MPGGLAIVAASVCALFTTFTGASGVTILALGGIIFPALIREGYPEGFSLGLVTASGSLGLLFPPSLPVILYGVVANVGIDHLYLGGLVPLWGALPRGGVNPLFPGGWFPGGVLMLPGRWSGSGAGEKARPRGISSGARVPPRALGGGRGDSALPPPTGVGGAGGSPPPV